MVVMRHGSLTLDAPGILWRLFSRSGRLAQHRSASSFPRIERATVRSLDGTDLPVEVDGDYIGAHREANYEVAAGSLLMVA